MATTVPKSINALTPNGFQFSIAKFPEVSYFMQEVNLPDISLGEAMQVSSVHDIRLPGDTMEFGDLQINFIIDERMENYTAISDWIFGLGFPKGHEQFTKFIKSERNDKSRSVSSKTVSDCTLSILNSDNLPLKTFTFVDAFPKSLSGISFSSINSDVTYLVASCTLAYSYYMLN